MTRPAQSRDERLNKLVSIADAIRSGMYGYDKRLSEFASGFPAGGCGSGTHGFSEYSSVERQVEATVDEGRKDPAVEAQQRFERRLEAAERAMQAFWDEVADVAVPRMGSAMVTKPGCELCATVPCGCDRCNAQDHRHHCEALYTVKRKPPKRKGQPPPAERIYKLCSSCYEFQRPDRADRLPTHDDVLDHVEGRRRRWKLGA